MAQIPDRLTLMHTFIRIVEAGSLSAAAAQLSLTQPTVSRRLQMLEQSLGLTLLVRSTHALRLGGRPLLPACPRTGADLERIRV
jgi:DNA-binding transcriptional LysR family regulator